VLDIIFRKVKDKAFIGYYFEIIKYGFNGDNICSQ
jgi:hypothetical protein